VGETTDEIVDGYRGRVTGDAIFEAARLITSQFIQTLPELEAV
jgi:hypothetical protein